MPILSTNIQSLAGVVSINIEHPNTAVYIDLLSMGTIDYEFDLVPTQEVTSYIGGIPGACSVTLRDDMSNRGSFFDSMESYIGDYDGSVALSVPSANVDLTLTLRQTGNVYTFPFQIKFSDIGLDERSRTASVKLQPRQPQINLGTWRDERLPIINTFPSISLPYVFEAFTYFSTPENTCPVGDVIYDLVGTLSNTPLHSNVYETAVNIGTVLVENARYGTVTAPLAAFPRQQLMANQGNGSVIASFMANGTSTQEYNPNKPMSEFLNQYAGMEGAIFGSAFDVNFYINRTINTYNVELSKVDVADLKFVSIPRSYNTVVFNTDKEPTFPDGVEIENANVVFQGWLDAQQQAKIAFRNLSPYIVVGCFEEDLGVVYNFTYVNNSGPIEDNSAINNTWVDSIFTRAYSAYAGALGLTSTNRGSLKIDVDILGVEKIRPYEVIKFDNTVPLRYQGKHFRPTSLSYDLKADRVRVSAYQISAFEVTPPEPPDTNVTINVGDCETGEMALMLSYGLENTFNVTSDETGENTSNFLAFNTFTNVFADEFGNMVTLQEGAFNVTAFSTGDGNISNVTGISL